MSNDSHLVSPMRYVRDESGRKATVVNPDNDNYVYRDLLDAETCVRRPRRSHLRRSQFPPEVRDARGRITKPPGW